LDERLGEDGAHLIVSRSGRRKTSGRVTPPCGHVAKAAQRSVTRRIADSNNVNKPNELPKGGDTGIREPPDAFL
jgi:hypothetical protein